MLARAISIGLLFCCAACSSLAPVAPPSHLRNTPGPAISLSDTYLDAGAFRLDYPASWRVVKLSGADAPRLRLALVAPDESALLLTQLDKADETHAGRDILRLSADVALRYEFAESNSPTPSFTRLARRIVDSIRA